MKFTEDTNTQTSTTHNTFLLLGIVIVSILIAVSVYIGYTMYQTQMLAMQADSTDVQVNDTTAVRGDENADEIDVLEIPEEQHLSIEEKLQILQAEDPAQYLSPDPDSDGNIIVEPDNFTVEEKKRYLIASQEEDVQQVEASEQEAPPEQAQ